MVQQLLLLVALAGDTVSLRPLAAAPTFDGAASASEYGASPLRVPTARGEVEVWLGAHAEWVYWAVRLPDATPSWRDEAAVLLDPMGDRTPGPGHDDAAWVIRRVADSSEVLRGVHGRWMLPGDDPTWRLGAARGGDDWEVRVVSDATGWSVELRIARAWWSGEYGAAPAMAMRFFDDQVREWVGWPAPPRCPAGGQLDRAPGCWEQVRSEK
jgi:hypothetical protein